MLRAAITACGLFGLSAVALAETPAGTAAAPAAVQIPADEWTNCRYKPLSGSHIKVQVCTAKDGADYRMDRKARTIAGTVAQAQVIGDPGKYASVPAPLPQVQ